jgi:hypothetical protein
MARQSTGFESLGILLSVECRVAHLGIPGIWTASSSWWGTVLVQSLCRVVLTLLLGSVELYFARIVGRGKVKTCQFVGKRNDLSHVASIPSSTVTNLLAGLQGSCIPQRLELYLLRLRYSVTASTGTLLTA